MANQDTTPVLQFSPLWQDAIVGYMLNLNCYEFFLRCYALLPVTAFEDPLNTEIVKNIYDTYNRIKVKRVLSAPEIEGVLTEKFIEVPVRRRYLDKLNLCIAATKNIGLDILSQDMTAWIKIVKLRASLKETEELYNQKKWKDIPEWLKAKMQDVSQSSFEGDDYVHYTNSVEFFKQLDEELKDCVTIGHPAFDELLLNGASKMAEISSNPNDYKTLTNGSLVKGDWTVIIGPTNSGKTTFVSTAIAQNILLGKSTLYITLEQKDKDLRTIMTQSLLNLTLNDLRALDKNEKHLLAVSASEKFFRSYLTHIHWNNPMDNSVETLVAKITYEQEKRIAETGFGYDLLVVDYPMLLTSKEFKGKKNASAHEEIHYIYRQFLGLARYHKFHVITPIQANREGNKKNKENNSNGFIGVEHTAGSFAIITDADNAISLNRGEKDIAANRIRFLIVKSRKEGTGTVFISNTDMARRRTHGINLTSQISTSASQISDDWLSQQFSGQQSFQEEVMGSNHSINVQELPVVEEKIEETPVIDIDPSQLPDEPPF